MRQAALCIVQFSKCLCASISARFTKLGARRATHACSCTVSYPISFSALLPTFLLRTQDLHPDNLLHHPHILRLPIYHAFQILQAVRQVFDFAVVEVGSVGGVLFDEEASADVNKDVCGGGEAPWDVEGGC